jgi:hypothetical protein
MTRVWPQQTSARRFSDDPIADGGAYATRFIPISAGGAAGTFCNQRRKSAKVLMDAMRATG